MEQKAPPITAGLQVVRRLERGDGLRLLRPNADDAPIVRAADIEADQTIGEGEKSVIASDADIVSGMKLRAPLADDDRARANRLTAVHLDTQALRL
jgi:hypothetical protein